MEPPTQAQLEAEVEGNYCRSGVPEGRRAFAMKRHLYTYAHASNMIVQNRFGVWSHRDQGYIRRTRYFKFVKIGWGLSRLRRVCQQHGVFAWYQCTPRREELEAAEAGLQKLFHRRMPTRFRKLKRRVVKEHERERRLLLKKQAHAAQGAPITRALFVYMSSCLVQLF
jgi:hypothetical protein